MEGSGADVIDYGGDEGCDAFCLFGHHGCDCGVYCGVDLSL